MNYPRKYVIDGYVERIKSSAGSQYPVLVLAIFSHRGNRGGGILRRAVVALSVARMDREE